ncbi:hypothetical protein Rcae01_01508 [Novipirellula caenicola]|uniref:Transposase n=1 Tax=Novipirellula caenicola TaxID=1536901 RepID=A0ABP9VPF2_9BACT
MPNAIYFSSDAAQAARLRRVKCSIFNGRLAPHRYKKHPVWDESRWHWPQAVPQSQAKRPNETEGLTSFR